MHVLHDSGKRREFDTGSVRDVREGKGRFDLISPVFLRRLALVMERGAAKYGERNWEKGQPLSCYIDSALRHINCLLQGEISEDHATQAAWNLAAFIHTQEMIGIGKLPEGLDDLNYQESSCPPPTPPPPTRLSIAASFLSGKLSSVPRPVSEIVTMAISEGLLCHELTDGAAELGVVVDTDLDGELTWTLPEGKADA